MSSPNETQNNALMLWLMKQSSGGAAKYVAGAVLSAVVMAGLYAGYKTLADDEKAIPLGGEVKVIGGAGTYNGSAPAHVTPVAAGTFAPSAPALETWQMVVAGAGQSKGGLTFLNSEANYKSPTCKTVVIRYPFPGDPRSLVGKTVVATGSPGTYNGQQQITLTDPSQLRAQ